jgi:hypothetical protein
VHKREKKLASAPLGSQVGRVNKEDHESPSTEGDQEQASPAAERAADAVVQRATRGLMRVDSRRRARVVLRRLCWLLILAGVIGGLGYYFADAVAIDLLSEYWDQLKDKLRPALPTESP